MAETLVQIHEAAINSAPSVVVEEAIGGWYLNYISGQPTRIGPEGRKIWRARRFCFQV